MLTMGWVLHLQVSHACYQQKEKEAERIILEKYKALPPSLHDLGVELNRVRV